jgi:hypothetical protein
MTDFDIERVVEFEIEQLKQDIKVCDNNLDSLVLYEQLVDTLELRIQQLKNKLQDITNEVTEY